MTLKYRKYRVEVLDENEEVKEVVYVSSWSEEGAIIKADKKVKGVDENMYKVSRVNTGE